MDSPISIVVESPTLDNLHTNNTQPSQSVGSLPDSINILKIEGDLSRSSSLSNSSTTELTLSFQNVFYRVATKPDPILKGVAGEAFSGKLTAILGPSGSGKSTLLDILARRKDVGTVSGKLELNGRAISEIKSYRRIVGYVTQEDIFIPTLTVYETVMFYANMRLPAATLRSDKDKRVKDVLALLGLTEVMQSKIGGELPGGLHVRGISGGQKRRLTIACALITAPRIIFLDEPTSGLDSASAQSVMKNLRKIASTGKMIVSSIHQPRAAVFFSFDSIILLGLGYPLYNGSPKDILAYLARHGKPFNNLDNPADFLLDFVADLTPEEMKQASRREFTIGEEEKKDSMTLAQKIARGSVNFGNNLLGTFSGRKRSPSRDSVHSIHNKNKEKGEQIPMSENQPTTPQSDVVSISFDAPKELSEPEEGVPVRINFDASELSRAWIGYRFWTLLHRALLVTIRNPGNALVRFLVFGLVGIIVGIVFYKLGDSQAGISSKVLAIFFSLAVEMLLPFTSISLFVDGRRFFNRESAEKLYSTTEYYLAIMTIESFQTILNSVFFCTIVYFMIGFQNDFHHYFWWALIHATHHCAGVFVIITFSNSTPHADLTFAVGSFIVTLQQLFCGALIPIGTLPSWTRWMRFVLFAKYSFEALVTNEFADNTAIQCQINEPCLFNNGTAVVDYFVPYKETNYLPYDEAIVFSFAALYFVLAGVALKYLFRQHS